jgi:hypothetical protein
VLLASLHLILRPVVTVTKLPDPKVLPGQVTYIEGSKDGNRGQGWMRKRQAFLDGQSIEVTEEELNTALVKPSDKPAAPARDVLKQKKKKEEEAKKDEPYLVPGSLNFRIADKLVQVSLPVRIPLLDTSVVIQAAGTFAKGSSGTFEFVPQRFYVGSLPLHKVPGLSEELVARASRADAVPEDLRAAWAKVTDVRIEERLLKVDLP